MEKAVSNWEPNSDKNHGAQTIVMNLSVFSDCEQKIPIKQASDRESQLAE